MANYELTDDELESLTEGLSEADTREIAVLGIKTYMELNCLDQSETNSYWELYRDIISAFTADMPPEYKAIATKVILNMLYCDLRYFRKLIEGINLENRIIIALSMTNVPSTHYSKFILYFEQVSAYMTEPDKIKLIQAAVDLFDPLVIHKREPYDCLFEIFESRIASWTLNLDSHNKAEVINCMVKITRKALAARKISEEIAKKLTKRNISIFIKSFFGLVNTLNPQAKARIIRDFADLPDNTRTKYMIDVLENKKNISEIERFIAKTIQKQPQTEAEYEKKEITEGAIAEISQKLQQRKKLKESQESTAAILSKAGG